MYKYDDYIIREIKGQYYVYNIWARWDLNPGPPPCKDSFCYQFTPE
nr:putative integrase [Sulfolobus acidocaldarius]